MKTVARKKNHKRTIGRLSTGAKYAEQIRTNASQRLTRSRTNFSDKGEKVRTPDHVWKVPKGTKWCWETTVVCNGNKKSRNLSASFPRECLFFKRVGFSTWCNPRKVVQGNEGMFRISANIVRRKFYSLLLRFTEKIRLLKESLKEILGEPRKELLRNIKKVFMDFRRLSWKNSRRKLWRIGGTSWWMFWLKLRIIFSMNFDF